LRRRLCFMMCSRNGTCTMHRAKHEQGGCVWITRGIDLHPLRVSPPLVPQLLDHCGRIPFPGVTLPLSRVFVQPCLLPVTQLLGSLTTVRRFPKICLNVSCFALGAALRVIRRIVFLLVMVLKALSPMLRSSHVT